MCEEVCGVCEEESYTHTHTLSLSPIRTARYISEPTFVLSIDCSIIFEMPKSQSLTEPSIPTRMFDGCKGGVHVRQGRCEMGGYVKRER